MALSSFVGSFNAGTGAAASTVAITGVGFQPKCMLFWWSGRSESTDTIGRASNFQGFGAAASTTSRASICANALDAVGTSDTQRATDQANVILSAENVTPVIDGSIDLQSFDADGATLVVTDQMPRDLRVHYLALGGDSLTNAFVGRFSEAGVVGDQAITGVGFQPDFVLFFTAPMAANPPTANTQSLLAFGAAVSSTAQMTLMGIGRDAQATSITRSYCTSGECLAWGTASVTDRADFVSFGADGFTINWAERSSGARHFFLCLKGGNYTVGNLLTQTDITTDIVESGFGFSPSSAMFFSHGLAESTSDTLQNSDMMSIGAFSSTTQRGAQAILDENGVADTEVTTAIEFDEVYINIATDSTIGALMDVKSVDSDGFTCIMDNADTAQAFVGYWAVGVAAVVAALPVTNDMRGGFNMRGMRGGFING